MRTDVVMTPDFYISCVAITPILKKQITVPKKP